jgi:hypothetical protein
MRMALIVPAGMEMPLPRIFRSNTRTQKYAAGTRAAKDDTRKGIMVKIVCPEPLHSAFRGNTNAVNR